MFIRCSVAVVLLFALAGCEKLFQKKADRALNQADDKAKAGDFRASIGFYEQALDGTTKTAEIHYKLALIYDDKLKEQVNAIHHFQRYLDLSPNGAHAKDAKKFVKQAEFNLLSTLSRGSFMSQQDAVQLKNDNLTLRQQVSELRARANSTPPKAGATSTPDMKKLPPGSRSYTVLKGDTLASISRKYYKTPGKAQDIQDANYHLLRGSNKLKPGQVLIIPK